MRYRRGFSKFEFALVVALVGVLATALLGRLLVIEAEAERTEVALTIRNIRVGIQLAIGERIMRGEEARLAEVARASPLDFLGQPPRGFVARAATPAAPGQWTYDARRRELAYRPRLPQAFAGAEELHWRYLARFNAAGQVVGASLTSDDAAGLTP